MQFLGMRGSCVHSRKIPELLVLNNQEEADGHQHRFFLYGERIRQSIQNAPHISPQLVEAYDPVMEFRADRHHMYIKSKKDPWEEWVQTKYKITEEDIQMVMQDWEPDWKIPAEGDVIV
jgi:hypothetical protein